MGLQKKDPLNKLAASSFRFPLSAFRFLPSCQASKLLSNPELQTVCTLCPEQAAQTERLID